MSFASYSLLVGIKSLTRVFYSFDVGWIGEPPEDPWNDDLAVIAILNHTSLYEPLLAGSVENTLLRQISRRGAVPIAEKTLRRPLVGRFFRIIAPHVIPVTTRRDRTWADFAKRATPGSLVVILPEGRMKRATGLDKDGKPMTVRGGIADLLRSTPRGNLLLAYSGGLHHIQVPGQGLPKLFKTLRLRFELLDIPTYCQTVQERTGKADFKPAVIADLEARRDAHCPSWDQPGPVGERAPSAEDGEGGQGAESGGGGEDRIVMKPGVER